MPDGVDFAPLLEQAIAELSIASDDTDSSLPRLVMNDLGTDDEILMAGEAIAQSTLVDLSPSKLGDLLRGVAIRGMAVGAQAERILARRAS